MGETLKSKAISGMRWSASSAAGRQGFQLFFLIVLTRILSPSDYGLLAMATALVGIGNVFSDIGISSALVQRQKLSPQHINTAYWMNILAGALIVSILLACSPLVVTFYNLDEVGPIFQIISINILVRSMVSVDKNILTKSMKFKQIAIIEFSSQIISGIFAVVLALSGWGVWSLVFRNILVGIIEFVAFSFLRVWRLEFNFSNKCFKDLWSFGGGHFGANILNYFSRNLDNIIIGKFLGEIALGYYNIAYRLMLKPMNLLGSVIYRVLFSTFSKLQNDHVKFRNGYQETLVYISILLFPIYFLIVVLGPEIILAISGPKWVEVGPIIQILAIVGVLQVPMGSVGFIYAGIGKTSSMFYWSIVTTILFTAFFIIGVNYNIIGVAIFYFFANIILFYPSLKIPYKYIDLKVGDVMRKIFPPFISALISSIAIFIFKYIYGINIDYLLINIFIYTAVGLLSYLFVLRLIKPEIIKKIQVVFR